MSAVQLPVPLAWVEKRGQEHFYVGHCNRDAYAMVQLWPKWSFNMSLIIGGEGSGKSHLASIWCDKSKAIHVMPDDLSSISSFVVAGSSYFVDDISHFSEESLFHLYNECVIKQSFILFTGREEDLIWHEGRIKDWYSRLTGLPRFIVGMPDEEVMLSVLMKLCHDRSIGMPLHGFSYLLKVLPRSFGVLIAFVKFLDHYLLSVRKKVTLPILKHVFSVFELNYNRHDNNDGYDPVVS